MNFKKSSLNFLKNMLMLKMSSPNLIWPWYKVPFLLVWLFFQNYMVLKQYQSESANISFQKNIRKSYLLSNLGPFDNKNKTKICVENGLKV